MNASDGSPVPAPDGTTVDEWALRRNPEMQVATISEPRPVLAERNLIAIAKAPDDVRELTRSWERLQPADGGVGTVTLTRHDAEHLQHDVLPGRRGPDPEGVTSFASRSFLKGAAPGAAIGAVVIGLMVWALVGGADIVVGAALGGAAFGFIAGGMGSFVGESSWGSAFEETFVDDRLADVVLVSIHAGDRSVIEAAAEAAHDHEVELLAVDHRGHTEPTGR